MFRYPPDRPTFTVTTWQLFTALSAQESVLKKIKFSLLPCRARSCGLVGHVSTHDNPADICTKLIPGGQKRDHLVGLILYDISDHK